MIQETTQPFESFVESVRRKASDAFNVEGKLLPTWFLQKQTGEVLFIVTEYETDLDKDFIAYAMQDTFVTQNIVRYAHITEAWIVVKESITSLKDYKGPRPSEHPNRREAVVLFAEDINGESLNGYCQIHRNPVDNTAMIQELKIINTKGTQEGRFVNLFKNRKSN